MLLLTCFLLFNCLRLTVGLDASVVYEWLQVDYTWNDMTKNKWIENGSYIMENNIITGIKVYNSTTYVTVPRWRFGIPSTLNKVVLNKNNNKPLLEPYPSWNMQDVTNCDALQNIQSMEIDPDGKMWIVDVGRKYFLDTNYAPNGDNRCPPKIILYDMIRNKIIKKHIFPDYVARHNNSFLNDIVIDYVNKIAYISDVFGEPYNGGIVVYDYYNNVSHRYSDAVMSYDGIKSKARNVTINGYTVQTETANDGIALSPDLNWLYFCPLSSYRLYRVPTYNVRRYNDDRLKEIEFIGNRRSNMDGMTFSNKSILYFGSFHETALYSMQYQFDIDESERNNYTKKHAVSLSNNNIKLQWIDTFAFDNAGYLYFTTNRLHRYFLGNMNWSNADGQSANIRVCKIYIGASSYMMYQANNNDNDGNKQNVGLTVIVLVIIFCILFIGLAVLCCSYYTIKKRRNNDKFKPLAGDDQLDAIN